MKMKIESHIIFFSIYMKHISRITTHTHKKKTNNNIFEK